MDRQTSATANGKRRLRVCICTSYAAHREPRAPRHAAALAAEGYDIHFVDAAPLGEKRVEIDALRQIPDLKWQTLGIPHSRKGVARRLAASLVKRTANTAYSVAGIVSNAGINSGLAGFQGLLQKAAADVYFAHNIDTLLPAWRAAKRRGALLMFDSMEYHCDMGCGQTMGERSLIEKIQKQCLKDCVLVTTASPEMADALQQEYQLQAVLPLYNVPRVTHSLAQKIPGFNMYWRNAVVNVGERGLGDVLQAMRELPADIRLHVQGRMPMDGGKLLKDEIYQNGLNDRVVFEPPYAPDQAVKEASRFQVGLCLERRGNRNHDLTVSNKMFDYHMAGLAVICSDLPGLKKVVQQSGGGIWYRAGDVDDLRKAIRTLYDDPALLNDKADQARRYALTTGNQEYEMQTFVSTFNQQVQAASDRAIS